MSGSGWLRRIAVCAFCATAFTPRAHGYGDAGHQTVGAIADSLIANSPNTVAHVRALIGTETLEHTSTWADAAKHHPDFHNAEMMAFIHANPHHAGTPGPHDQNEYHYTDIPIQEAHYRAGSVGASKIDVVHMIRNCIAILEGHSNASNNPTKIPPQTALRLLVHYLGDVHQPLHVGAIYFGPQAQPVNPNTVSGVKFATGGNDITFQGVGTNLHAYWDANAVQHAMSAAHATTPRAFANTILANPPPISGDGAFMSTWSTRWAGELLPISAQAHNKLTFQIAGEKWTARSQDLAAYNSWAAAEVRTELGRAGYRLAAILKKIWP